MGTALRVESDPNSLKESTALWVSLARRVFGKTF
jgi:hypothetical protein